MDKRAQCLEFAAEFPTYNVKRAIRAAENGVITWDDCYSLFFSSLRDALASV